MYVRFAAGRKMGLASQETVFLFNYRAQRDRDILDKLVFISGRGDGSQPKDGVRALHSILKDAIENHGKTCLKVPRKAIIKLKSKAINKRYMNIIFVTLIRWNRDRCLKVYDAQLSRPQWYYVTRCHDNCPGICHILVLKQFC